MSKHNRNRDVVRKEGDGLIPNNAEIIVDDKDNTGIVLQEATQSEEIGAALANEAMLNENTLGGEKVEDEVAPEPIVNTEDDAIVDQDTESDADLDNEELAKLLENVKNAGLGNLYKLLHAAKNTKDILAILVAHEPNDINDKLFILELKDICTQLLVNTNESINKVNSRLYSVLINTLRNKDVERFDILNIIFAIDNKGFEPSNLLRAVPFTHEAKTLVNYQQLVTILEVLSNKKTRKANSSQIANFRHLSIGEDAITFIKQYYKL